MVVSVVSWVSIDGATNIRPSTITVVTMSIVAIAGLSIGLTLVQVVSWIAIDGAANIRPSSITVVTITMTIAVAIAITGLSISLTLVQVVTSWIAIDGPM